MQKKLTRDSDDQMVGGVIAGLAKYFQQDPVLFRVVAIVLMILSGIFPVLIGYVIAWIMIPESGKKDFDYEVE